MSTKLSNTQIKALVNASYGQMTDSSDITELDLTGERERFTGALIGVCTKNCYTDTDELFNLYVSKTLSKH